MRPKLFSGVIKVSTGDDLRAALAQAAADERTSVSEVARRVLREGLAERPGATAARATRAA